MADRDQTLTLPGRRLVYRAVGDGAAAVLFVHAFPLTGAMWRPQLEALPPGWRGLAPDLRGLGGSRGAPARSMDDHADDLDALLAALDLPSAVVVGLSMGGYAALALAARRPDRVRALVLADTRAEPDTEAARARRDATADLVQKGGVRALADAMLPQLLGRSTHEAQPDVVRHVGRLIVENGAEGVVEALTCLRDRPDRRAMLPELGCPTLVVVGEEDGLTPSAVGQAMARAMPDATCELVPHAGHLSSLEQPAAFNAALHRFLRDRCPPPAGR